MSWRTPEHVREQSSRLAGVLCGTLVVGMIATGAPAQSLAPAMDTGRSEIDEIIDPYGHYEGFGDAGIPYEGGAVYSRGNAVAGAPTCASGGSGGSCSDSFTTCTGCTDCLCTPWWGSIEYLMWWEKGTRLPPLATTSPANTDRDAAGVLGEPTTSVLFGDERVTSGDRSGGRLTFGKWFDACDTCGIGARFWGLDDRTVEFLANSDQYPILARPFFNVFTAESDALLVGFPGEFEGSVAGRATSDVLGTEVFLRKMTYMGCNYRFDWIAGYRYTRIDESLSISNSLEFIDPNGRVPVGTIVDQTDLFDTRNDFHGGEIGLLGHSRDGNWTMDVMVKVALGNMRQRVGINGGSITSTPGAPVFTETGGLLTQESNIGQYENNEFAVVTEVGVTAGYQLTSRLDFSVGYSLVYWDHVMQPGDAIDLGVNLTQRTGVLIGEPRPEFSFDDTSYWLQGINFALNYRY